MKAIILIGLAAIILVSGCISSAETTGNVISSGGAIKIPVSGISSQAKFYEYETGGKTVNFFAVLGNDGEVRTAFDACDVCGGAKGYRQEGHDMVCNNCGRHFSIDSIGTENRGGGCWPSYLSHTSDGEHIMIGKNELEGGAWRF